MSMTQRTTPFTYKKQPPVSVGNNSGNLDWDLLGRMTW